MLSKNTNYINNIESSIVKKRKLLINYLINNYLNDGYSIDDIVNETEEIGNIFKKNYQIFKNEIEATIVLFCSENKLIYLGCLRKIYPTKNPNTLRYYLEKLNRMGIIRLVNEKEYLKEKQIFQSTVIKNSRAGFYQVKKIIFYSLTDFYKEFPFLYMKKLKDVSKHVEFINNYKQQISKTYAELKNNIEKTILYLRGIKKDPKQDYERVLKFSAEKLNISTNELKSLVLK